MQVDLKEIDRIIRIALAEDIGDGDITSNLVIPKEQKDSMSFVPREDIVACGFPVISRLYQLAAEDMGVALSFEQITKEGELVESGQIMAKISGNSRAILATERVALNLLQHMCGIATQANKFAQEVAGLDVKILDTRKTLPGLRWIEKYAVFIGGCYNHRMGLYDMIMIKDNHILAAGSITKAIEYAKNSNTKLMIEVECDNFEQVKEAVTVMPNRIMLDNMSITELNQSVEYIKNNGQGEIEIEASGNVTISTIKEIAQTGIDYISSGALTHSAPNSDIGLD